jgi:gas vesicle protein
MGSHLVQSLQAQYQKVKTSADAWKQATERRLDEISNSAGRQGGEAQSAYSDMRERSKAAAQDLWERSEPLRQGARDVGDGVVRAWSELRASFGKAAGRLSSSEPPASDANIDDQEAS